MWDLVTWPGIEARSPALGAQRLSHWTTREVHSEKWRAFPGCGQREVWLQKESRQRGACTLALEAGKGTSVDTTLGLPEENALWTPGLQSRGTRVGLLTYKIVGIINLGHFKTAREKAYRRKTQEKGKGIFTCFHTAALPLCADAGSRSGTFQIFLENN